MTADPLHQSGLDTLPVEAGYVARCCQEHRPLTHRAAVGAVDRTIERPPDEAGAPACVRTNAKPSVAWRRVGSRPRRCAPRRRMPGVDDTNETDIQYGLSLTVLQFKFDDFVIDSLAQKSSIRPTTWVLPGTQSDGVHAPAALQHVRGAGTRPLPPWPGYCCASCVGAALVLVLRAFGLVQTELGNESSP